MKEERVNLEGWEMAVYSLNTVVVGSGAAALNAADRLYTFGQRDVAVVTEGMKKGTSRNTGSDKQTYYKLTLAGAGADSVRQMAETLYQGGSMQGDIALIEAALSPQCFYHLVDIGVPFPHNRMGEYIGYKTDHDPRQRATSVGPLTSKMMTDKLEEQVIQKNIDVFDGYQAIGVLTDSNEEKCVGLLAINLKELEDPRKRYVLFNCTNLVFATGGPAGIYDTSVYPVSQTGSTGIAFEAGVKGVNLTESQFGIASIKFRWNLSGTYQQVLPRYVSTDQEGNDEREFLNEYFTDIGKMLDAIFLKGYQWPFDPRKIENYGSSLIDVLVYNETVNKGRRVFLDFMHNLQAAEKDGQIDFSLLGEESYQYLKNSKALFGKPIDRLQHMNQPAIDLYLNNGIDLHNEYLEIAVCAQHNNGGLQGDIWWQSNLKNFFPVGEVNGTHGVYRPGGSALNSGQVGSTRAAQFIVARCKDRPLESSAFLQQVKEQVLEKLTLGEQFLQNKGNSNVAAIRKTLGQRMSASGGVVRSLVKVRAAKEEAKNQLESLGKQTVLGSVNELPFAYKNWDLLLTQYVYLTAIEDYIEKGGGSRGSYLIFNEQGDKPLAQLPDEFRFFIDDGSLNDKVQEIIYDKAVNKNIIDWSAVRPIPEEDNWFENVWNAYMRDEIIR